MSVIDIFHAPRGFVFEDFETRGVLTDRGEVTLRYPVLTPETVQDFVRDNALQSIADIGSIFRRIHRRHHRRGGGIVDESRL